jgi:hypothetical protein
MEFLSYTDDADSSSDHDSVHGVEGNTQAVVPSTCRWTEVSSDDDSDADDDAAIQDCSNNKLKSTGILPSVDDLFSSVEAKFSFKPTKEILDEVLPIETNNAETSKAPLSQNPTLPVQQGHQSATLSKTTALPVSKTSSTSTRARTQSQSAATSGAAQRKREEDKETAKVCKKYRYN